MMGQKEGKATNIINKNQTNSEDSSIDDSMSPRHPDLSPLLTDLYQLSMGYSYFLQGRHQMYATFDVFYRKNPFDGLYTIYFGAKDVTDYIKELRFTDKEVDYVLKTLKINNAKFKKYLSKGFKEDIAKVKLVHIPEGTIAQPKVPLMRVEGPLFTCQLIETAVLALTGFATLVGTNGSRIAAISGRRKVLEFGLRRAQGPNGALTASKYAVLGGCIGTSNVLTGFQEEFEVKGTMAHSYICSFQGFDENSCPKFVEKTQIYELARRIRIKAEKEVPEWRKYTNLSGINLRFQQDKFQELSWTEFYAFVAYASDYPNSFLALIDTYDTIYSGALNFLYVAFALMLRGHNPVGVRLDSGNLGRLAQECREVFGIFFNTVARKIIDSFEKEKGFLGRYANKTSVEELKKNLPNDSENRNLKKVTSSYAKNMVIAASNDLHEDSIRQLLKDYPDLQIDTFGVGTHLATCKSQPALGCVYKLTSLDGKPCVKFSNDEIKQTYPGGKQAFRLYSKGIPVADLLTAEGEGLPDPKKHAKVAKRVVEIQAYNNADFSTECIVQFDEALNLYVDHIDVMLSQHQILGCKVSTIVNKAKEKTAIPREVSEIKSRIHKTFFEKLELMYPHSERLTAFEFLKVKAETMKVIFSESYQGFLFAKRNEPRDYEYPVYLSKELRDAVRASRGLK